VTLVERLRVAQLRGNTAPSELGLLEEVIEALLKIKQLAAMERWPERFPKVWSLLKEQGDE
jgi:hypothetical protein